jgi:hypothetical protein
MAGARTDRVRHQLFLPRSVSERLESLARAPGASKSAILAAALAAWLDRRGTDELELRFARRLDRITGQLARIERDGHFQVESLALFIRYMLAVNAPLAEDDEAGRAIGRDRFAAFIGRVSQQVAGGRRSFEPEDRG